MDKLRTSLVVGLVIVQMVGSAGIASGTKGGITDQKGLEEAHKIRRSLKIEEMTSDGFSKAHLGVKDIPELTRMGNLYRKSLQRHYVEEAEATFKFLYRMATEKRDYEQQSFAAWKLAKIYSRTPLTNREKEAEWISKGLTAVEKGGENEKFLRWVVNIPEDQYGVLRGVKKQLTKLVGDLYDYDLSKSLSFRFVGFEFHNQAQKMIQAAPPPPPIPAAKDKEAPKPQRGAKNLNLASKEEWPVLGSKDKEGGIKD